MTARSSICLALFVGVMQIADAGVKRTPRRHVIDEGKANTLSAPIRETGRAWSGGLDWVLVDSMTNAYSMLSNRVDPVAFDPVSRYVGIVHRGFWNFGIRNGQLWYNTSRDGLNWIRISELNAGMPLNAAYPSCWIASGGGAGSELFAFSAPQLNPATLGWVIWGFDPLNAGTPFAVEDQGGPYWSNTRVTAADDSPTIFWAASYDINEPNSANSAVHLWTANFETDVWDLSLFQTRGLEIGLCYRNGVLYLGGYASLIGDPNEVMNVFYSKSTDDGQTWSAPDGPNIGVGDWRTLPGLTGTPYTDWHPGDSFDMLVDAAGRVHIFGVVVDSVEHSTEIAVIDVSETDTGWDASIISAEVATTTRTDYGGVDQMGFHVNAAATPTGDVLSLFWLAAPTEGDTLPDIFLSLKGYYEENWYSPINITQTPDLAELLLHVAPICEYVVDDAFRAYVARAYERGTVEYPPNSFVPTDIFVAPVVLFANDVNTGSFPVDEYQLGQNYPNPFNAQTRIDFTVGSRQSAVLKVHDVLGREVATLVNEPKDAGTHSVTWDAAGLPSGVYFYRLQAGGYVETRRLVLVR